MDLIETGKVDKIQELARSLIADAMRAAHRGGDAPGGAVSQNLGLSEKEKQIYSIERGARTMLAQRGGFTGLESECHLELAKRFGPCRNSQSFYVPREVLHQAPPPGVARAMSTIPGSSGGYMVGVEIVSFVDQLQAASVTSQLAVETMMHPGGNVTVAKQVSGPTYVWLGPPGTAVSASDPAFGQLSATPKTIVSLTEISAQAVHQMGPVSEHFTRRNLALGLAAGKDSALLVGTGAEQPLGILNTPGISSVVGTSLDRAKALDCQTKAANLKAIVNPERQGYVSTPTIAALLANRQEYTGVASTLWGGSIARGTMAGLPAMSTTAMTAGSLLYGDFSQVIFVEFGPLQIAVNHADFNKGTLAVRALWMVDQIVIEPKAFTLATSVT